MGGWTLRPWFSPPPPPPPQTPPRPRRPCVTGFQSRAGQAPAEIAGCRVEDPVPGACEVRAMGVPEGEGGKQKERGESLGKRCKRNNRVPSPSCPNRPADAIGFQCLWETPCSCTPASKTTQSQLLTLLLLCQEFLMHCSGGSWLIASRFLKQHFFFFFF